jgi:tight adherence protein B
VDRLEDGLRAEQECRDEVESELAGPRSTALMLAVLPGFGLFLGAGLGAHPVHVLLHTPLGGGCLLVGVLLDLAGVWWTGRIVRAAAGAS